MIQEQPEFKKYLDTYVKRKRLSQKYASSLVAYSYMIQDKDPAAAQKVKERGWRVGACGNVMEVDKSTGKVVSIRSCGDRFCPICAHKKAMEYYHTNLELVARDPGHYAMMTLTLPNCYPEALGENIKLMRKSWNLYSFDWFRDGLASGGISGLEVTFSPELQNRGLPSCHPHLHFLLHVSDEYYQELEEDMKHDQEFRPYPRVPFGVRENVSYTYRNGQWEVVQRSMKSYARAYKWRQTNDKIRERWQRIIGMPFVEGLPMVQCEIHPVVSRNGNDGLEAACREVSKYILKCTEYAYNSFVVGTFLLQMDKVRQYTYLGSWRKLKASLAKDEEYCQKTQVLRNSEDITYLVFDAHKSYYIPYDQIPGWVETIDDVSESIRSGRRALWRQKRYIDYLKLQRIRNRANKQNSNFEEIKIS